MKKLLQNSSPSSRQSAFTLIELLVVIAILALMASLLIPVVGGVLERGRRTQCLSKMRELVIAATLYMTEKDQIPPVRLGSTSGPRWYEEEILGPYIGGPFDHYTDPSGSYAVPPPGSVLQCPSKSVGDFNRPEARWIGLNNQTTLRWFVSPWSDEDRYTPGIYSEVDKPHSQVVLFADSSGFGLTYLSNYIYNDGGGFVGLNPWSGFNPRHQGGANYAFMDGHATFFKNPDQAFFNQQMYLVPSTLWDKDKRR